MQYEKLLSVDPIGAFNKIKENYKRYFESAYLLRTDLSAQNNMQLDKKRIDLLDQDDNLYKSPYIEMLPEYASEADLNCIDDLANDPDIVNALGAQPNARLFIDFIKKGLMDYVPYGHQVKMLKEAFVQGNNTVITSGTGSGKTESFLLPLFAQIFKEALSWPRPNYTHSADWYTINPYMPCQREGEVRPAALRAIVLYPMNALVEDQVRRLRKALDSDAVRALMDDPKNGLNGNRIFFGQYNGSTIGQKSYGLLQQEGRKLAAAQQKINDGLDKLLQNYQTITAQTNSQDNEYITSRLNGQTSSEMVTRWDMQNFPPDIMITNVSMLSIMLMRSAENDIIRKTREWLAEDPCRQDPSIKPTRIFHMVVDELHLYRDTAGSEVACLIRMLLKELDLDPVVNGRPNPQLRILASSASLGDNNQTEKFLEEFFGVYNSNGQPAFADPIEGSEYKVSAGKNVPYDAFSVFDESFVEMDDNDKQIVINNFLQTVFCNTLDDFIVKYQGSIYNDFYGATHHSNKTTGIKIDDLIRPNNPGLFSNMESLRGFLIFRAHIDNVPNLNHRLPRFRFHQFFKYIEGLWGELQPTVYIANSQKKIVNKEPISDLAYLPKEIGVHKHKMLELLRCECCGQLYIGGNINRDGERPTLSLNVPNLAQIPSFNPTPMVQNKSFNDYAIFYPTHTSVQLDLRDNGANNENEDHCSLLSDGNSTYTRTKARAQWDHAYLSPLTGEIRVNQGFPDGDWIEGYIYSLESYNNQAFDPKLIAALPCTCPHCKINYMKRKYTKSPIRSFRTGIDRSNQLLSKELMYQLSERGKKLIGFSDSREDAAKQAAGIATEHYRDMVRLLFVDEIKNIQSQLVSTIQTVTNATLALQKAGIDPLDTYRGKPLEYSIAKKILNGINVPSDIIPIHNFERDNGPIANKLIDLGINPRGVQPNDENWSDAYSTPKNDPIEELSAAIFNNAFGLYMGVSVCDTGIGYVCIDPDILQQCNPTLINDLQNLLNNQCSIQDFLDSFLRVMGDNFRYINPNYADNPTQYTRYDDIKSSMRLFVQRAANALICQENNLGNALFKVISCCTNPDQTIRSGQSYRYGDGLRYMIIEMPSLAFRIIDPEAHYYYCENCHRVHPIRGLGFCTRCGGALTLSNDKNKDLWQHYISHDILVERRNPMRLHTEELTGQTDDIQSRLLQFKDIVYTDQSQTQYAPLRKKSLPIDMVCVTTTMEVGVDIGSLEAIYQGNMPPTRYNYQQRVGRGGRRGQAFATAITFCRGRSHDLYYYEKATDRIVGGKVEPPTLALAPYQDGTGYHMKLSIMKRVITKHIMHLALQGMYDPDLHDTAAEFGRVDDWLNGSPSTESKLANWLAQNAGTVDIIVDYYLEQFNTTQTPIANDIHEMKRWVKKELVNKISTIATSYPDPTVGLGQCLVEMGILPKYGMPLDVRYLYHGYVNGDLRTIDRSSEMAITEFAPGSEKTKDKGKYKVSAICVPMSKGPNNTPTYINTNADALQNKYVVSLNNDQICQIDPYINAAQLGASDKIVVIPQAYRTDVIVGNRGKSIDNDDRGSRFAQSEVWAKEGTNGSSKVVENCRISAFGFASNDAEVWHLNTNNRRWYSGYYGAANDPNNGRQTTFTFIDQPNGQTEQIGLGAKKVTEMVSIEINNVPSVLDLNCDSGNDYAIRAAFISAGFLLQRALADKLDVTPEEIEVVEKIINGRLFIYLSDALPNGAGIVGYLFLHDHLRELIEGIINFKEPFMQSLIDPNHKDKCFTACQECIASYSNRGYHHILDWRMGVGVLRLMLNENYDFGFDPNNRQLYEELKDYDALFDAASIKVDGNTQAKWIDQLYSQCAIVSKSGHKKQTKMVYKVLYHPLWNKQALFNQKLASIVGANEVEYHNLFKVLRSDLTPDQIQTPSITSSPTNQTNPIQPTHQQEITMKEGSNSQEERVVDETTGVVLDIDL